MRKTIVVALLGVLLAACGQAPRTGPIAGDDILFIASGSSVSAVDARTHTAVVQLPLGVPSADWKHYYIAAGGRLDDYNPMTGSVVRSFTVPEGYALPVVTASGSPGGLSQNGRYLVLQGPTDGSSHLMIVDTSFAIPPVRIDDLKGDFTFDAITNDATRVYLIQHTSDGHYYVRDYVIGSGLDPTIIFDKSDGSLAMSGVRLMGVPAPDGSTLYSVYAREDRSAFIHQLYLGAPIAICIDLSGPGYATDRRAMRWSLAISSDGSRLFAANGALGVITELWLNANNSRTVPLDGGAMAAAAGTTLTPDGTHLVVAGAGVRWLDSSTLKTTATALGGWTVAGDAFTPDGGSLYVVSNSGQVAHLSPTGSVLATFDSGLGAAASLLSVQRFS